MSYISRNSAVIVKGARYMPCTLLDETANKKYEINIKEPKLKVYRRFEKLGENASVEEFIEVTAAILNSNKENMQITPEFVEDNFTIDEIAQFFDDFTNWLAEARESNPN